MTILFTFGVNDRGKASVKPDRKGRVNFHVDGNCNVLGNLDLGKTQGIPIMLFGPDVPQPPLDLSETPSLIFNQISDADSHSTSLSRCQQLCRNFDGVPVINHPIPVLLNSLEKLKDLRMAANRDDIPSRYADFKRLRNSLN